MNRSTVKTLGVAAALTLVLAACGDDNLLGPLPEDAEYAASLGIDLADFTESPTGLLYRDDIVGTGSLAGTGDIVSVDFTGWLADGTVFDSGTFPFQLGVSAVIAGFVEGVTGMQLGGDRTVIVPAQLAYGSDGRQNVPGDAVLIFNLVLTALN